MRRMLRDIKWSMAAAALVILGCVTPWAWADDSASPVTLAVVDFSLSLDIANPDDAAQDSLPARLAGDTLRRLASQSERYELADDGAQVAGFTCTNTDCALQHGRELGVQRVIWGQITKVSALIWFVSAHLVNVPAATTLHAETLQFRGNVTDVVPRLSQILWRRMHEGD